MTTEATGTASQQGGGEPKMYEVKLSKVVVIEGFRYLPGAKHEVDDMILAAMHEANAVENVTPS